MRRSQPNGGIDRQRDDFMLHLPMLNRHLERWIALVKIEERDEPAYPVALIAGTFAVLHDKQSDGTVGVPLDLLPEDCPSLHLFGQ